MTFQIGKKLAIIHFILKIGPVASAGNFSCRGHVLQGMACKGVAASEFPGVGRRGFHNFCKKQWKIEGSLKSFKESS